MTPQQPVQVDNQRRLREADTVTRDRAFHTEDFEATMSTINGPASYAAGKLVDGAADPRVSAASVTNLTINRVAGASVGYGYGAPYLATQQAGTGFNYGPSSGAAFASTQQGFNLPPGGNVGGGGAGAGGLTGAGFSSDYYEKRALLAQMNDANWQMLLLQNDVQNVNREFTIFSNVLSVKHQTEMNEIRNMGRASG